MLGVRVWVVSYGECGEEGVCCWGLSLDMATRGVTRGGRGALETLATSNDRSCRLAGLRARTGQIVASTSVLLRRDAGDDQIYRARPAGPCSFYAYASASSCQGSAHGAWRSPQPTMEDVTKELLRQSAGRDSRPVPGLGSRVLQRRRDPAFERRGCRSMPVVYGRKPDHPAGPQRLAGLQGDEAERLVRVHPSDPRMTGDGADLRQAPAARGRRAGSPIYALGHRPQAVRLGQGHLPEPIRVETSYRQMNQCRIRTRRRGSQCGSCTWRSGSERNLWVWLHYAVLSSPHRGCRRYNLDRLTLRTMLLWLQEVAFSMYELVKIALCERSVPERLTC